MASVLLDKKLKDARFIVIVLRKNLDKKNKPMLKKYQYILR
jgi:hypothetical protein